MSSTTDLKFHKLFQNSTEGDETSNISGNLPDWFLKENIQVLYNGPVGIWDHQYQTVKQYSPSARKIMQCFLNFKK